MPDKPTTSHLGESRKKRIIRAFGADKEKSLKNHWKANFSPKTHW